MAFVYAVVGVAPSPADTGLTLEPADGAAASFPDPADGTFDVLCVAPRTRIDAGHTEVLHVTELSGDEWTIERVWWDTTAREIAVGDVLIYNNEFDAGDLLNRTGLDSLPHVYTFTESGNWTAPLDTTYFSVALLGGGGGGAGGQVGNPVSGGGGGGGGAWAYMPATSMEPFGLGYDFDVTIGAGGAGGAASTNGADGDDSVFSFSMGGVLMVADSGKGGQTSGTGGDGGDILNPDWAVQDSGGSGGDSSTSSAQDGFFATYDFHRSSSGGGGGGWNDGGGTHAGALGGWGNFVNAEAEADGESGASVAGAGGGGGGNGGNTTGTDGGNGGIGGGGGGGGGAGGTTAGAGGDGGGGLCFIYAH